MILGRSLTLWTGAAQAALNALVILGVLPWTADAVAAVNVAIAAVLALLASSDALAVRKGEAAAERLARKGGS